MATVRRTVPAELSSVTSWLPGLRSPTVTGVTPCGLPSTVTFAPAGVVVTLTLPAAFRGEAVARPAAGSTAGGVFGAVVGAVFDAELAPGVPVGTDRQTDRPPRNTTAPSTNTPAAIATPRMTDGGIVRATVPIRSITETPLLSAAATGV